MFNISLYIPSAMFESPICSTSSLTFSLFNINLFNFSLGRYVVASSGFNLMLSTFSCAIWPLIYLPWWDIFAYLKNWFATLLYIYGVFLDTNLLFDICITYIFFQFVACIFIFLVYFIEQKFLVLMKSNLSVFFPLHLVPFIP